MKKERPYALCAECWRVNGTLPGAWFGPWARLAEREAAQVSCRAHPLFGKAARVYARRRQRVEAQAALEAGMPRLGRELAVREADEDGYDGLGPYVLEEHVAWERDGVELPEPEHSERRGRSDKEIQAWDARVDALAAGRGFSLSPVPAPELQPWGDAVDVDGALVSLPRDCWPGSHWPTPACHPVRATLTPVGSR